jgi:branched-chain amino acid transport system substrate-binding protein
MNSKMFVLKGMSLALIVFMALVPWVVDAASVPAAVKVGTVISLTGRMASGGKDVRAGYELAVKHINTNGGVYVAEFGKKIPIELIMVDDESDPVKTVTRLDKLNTVDQVTAYLGGYSSIINVAGMGVAEKNKVPWVGITITVEEPFKRGYKYIFAPFSMTSLVVGTYFDLLNSVPENQRPRKIAHFELQSDWGNESARYVREYAKKGFTVVVDQKYSLNTTDFASLILASKSAGAETLFSVSSPTQSMTMIRQMKELSYAPKVTYFVAGPDLTTFWDSMGKDANYIIASMNWDESLNFPLNKELVRDYRAANPGTKLIGNPVGSAYAAVQVLANAIEKAGALDREKIRTALVATDMMTVRGRVRFKSDGEGIVLYGLSQWHNGKLDVVFPPEVATAPFLLAPPWEKR